MKKLESIKKLILGDTDQMSSERYFITITTVVASVFALAICVFRLIHSPSIEPVLFDASTFIIMLVLYYFVRFQNSLFIPKTILTIGGLILGDLTWYSQFLSNGPVLLFILIFAALVLWVWEGKALMYFMIFYFLNLIVLFYIDYNAPDFLFEYPDRESRSIDIFVSLFMYSILLLFLLYTIKREFLRQKEKAIHSDKLKSAFLANMSHEIRTPMNGILGFSNLLKEPNLSDNQQQQYIEIIEKSGHRMLNIINDIVDISKIEAGLMTVDIKESNINEQIEYIYKFFEPEVEAKGMKLIFKNSLPSKDSIITTDREKVFAIFTNLIKNAIKYSNKGEIKFGYNIKGNYVEFYVKDSGIGIAKDRQQAIFERFIQADNEDKQVRQGTGLGLAITKSYVEMLGGKIWVESEPGVGSTFYFTLPYNPVSKEKKVNQTNLRFDVKELNTLYLKILIVEDDEASEALISITVKDFCKSLLKAKTGTEAVEICRNNPDIDLILMDIQLPKMNGYEATRQIRQFNKEVIIIAQTAYGLSGDREKAIEAGCNDYISKPIVKDKLLQLILVHGKKHNSLVFNKLSSK